MHMKKAKLLIVDDEPDVLSGLKQLLSSEGFTVETVECGKNVMEEAVKFSPDLILMDILLGDINGYELKEQLKRNIDTAAIPVVFMSANKSLDYKSHGYKSGAEDYIVKPLDTDDLIIRIESILTRKKFYENMCMKDPLTGLYNKSLFDKQTKILYSLAKKYSRPFSIAVIDIKGLKNINKSYGHEAGDFILKKMAEEIKGIIRNMDIATRYSSDEFAVLLPETDNEQSHAFLNRIKESISNRDFKYGNNKKITFDISTGSATCNSGEIDLEKMFSMVDLNMYVENIRQEKTDKKSEVLIIEDEMDIARGVQLGLEAEGFVVRDILYKFEDAVSYIDKSSSGNTPGFVILDLDLGGRLSADILGVMYSKWKNTRVYIYTAYMQYVDQYPYLRDVVCGVFEKSELTKMISSLKENIQ